jgi:sulfate adenylyltransferase subunit 1
MSSVQHTQSLLDAEHSSIAETSVLRFITCGSVDDGKSTLIGRLLFDAKAVFADQIEAIGRAKHKRTTGNTVDLSLLTDGLEAEREQGITIDVAYRYFATPQRKFIIADTPGHEQYTRNMVTGASTADAALLLIDPTRVIDGQLLPQTKRHAALAKLLGTRHIIAVVNKMDLIDYSQTQYDEIVTLLGAMSESLDLPQLTVIPVSALQGDNVVNASDKLSWYTGQPLLPLLESLPANDDAALNQPMRFTVQYVIRTDGSKVDDFRGFSGFVASGNLRVGDAITVQPSGAAAVVARLHTYDGDLTVAHAGDAVTVVLDRDVDISRGDTLISASDSTVALTQFKADLCWMDATALSPARKYWLKMGAKTGYAKISAPTSVLDIASLNYSESEAPFGLNAIGVVNIAVQQAVLADDYHVNKATGAFVLIDTASHQTVAAGMVRLV